MTNYTLADAREAVEEAGLEAEYFECEAMTDIETVYETEAYKNIFKHYVNDKKRGMIQKVKEGSYKNYKAYIIGEDVYEVYTIPEGFAILHKVCTGCMLSNASFNQVVFTDDGFAVIARNWKNCKENRKVFAQEGFTVTTDL